MRRMWLKLRGKLYRECKGCGKEFRKRDLVKFGKDDWFCSENCFVKFGMEMGTQELIDYIEKDRRENFFM